MLARVPLVLAALATLLAGCTGGPGGAPPPGIGDGLADAFSTDGVVHGADGLRAPGAPAHAARGLQRHTGVDAVEPTIGVTAENVLWITGFGEGARRYPTVLKSEDAGATWSAAGPTVAGQVGVPPTTNDPFVHVDVGTGRVFMADLEGLTCTVLSFSDDGGASWITNPVACGTPGANDHQSVTTAKPRALPTVGYPNLVYYCVNRIADTSCATSTNGGLAFGPLVTVTPGAGASGFCGGLAGHVKSAPDGTVYLPKAACSVPTVYVSEDDGVTWTERVIAPDHLTVSGDHEVSVGIDEAGNVHAFWLSEGLPFLASSADKGATWTTPRMVARPGVTATAFNAIAAGAEGRVAFAYLGTTIEGGYEGKPTGVGGLGGDLVGEPEPEEWAAATWNAYLGVVTDAFADELTITTVTANPPADPLARGLCGRTRCAGMADFIDVDVGPDGRPWAAFVDVCTEECREDEEVKKDTPIGLAATLSRGPALRGDLAALAPLGN